MFFRKSVAVVAMALLSSFAAYAKELTFKFKVESSGPTLYMCNAGIKHGTPSVAQICHVQGGTAACLPSDPNCVCTSTTAAHHLMDFMRFQTRPWLQSSGTWGDLSTPVAMVAGKDQYKRIVESKDSFKNMLDSVTFSLGSEQYGACYHVDVCFKGAQIDYHHNIPSLSIPVNVEVYGTATLTDLQTGDSRSYTGLAKPKVRAVVHCDKQGKGTYKYASNGSSPASGFYDTLDNDIDFTAFDNSQSGNSDFTYGTESTFTAFSANTQVPVPSVEIVKGTSHYPRFCVIRYEFCESQGAERKWQRHDAQFKVFTRVSEPPVGDNGNGGGENGGGHDNCNNGVGNGEDCQPPGNPPVNDGEGTGPGNPGNGGNGGNGRGH